MATALKSTSNVRESVSDEEWNLRVDLAAAYRLVAHYGWARLIFTPLLGRLAGAAPHFLIHSYNLQF